MAWSKPTHALLLVTDTGKTWENRKPISNFTQVAVGRENDSGNLFFDIPRGMLIWGKLLVKPITEKKEKLSENWDSDDDLPF